MIFSGRKIVIFVLVSIVACVAVAQEVVEEDGSVLLPMQNAGETAFNYSMQQQLGLDSRWQNFLSQHGKWSVQWNEATHTPHRAFGEAIKIPGYSRINQSNVEAAARTFLENYKSVLRINPNDVALRKAIKVRQKWYVSFYQTVNNIEVLLSEVELRIFENGNVMAFGVDFYPDITISTTPTLTPESAELFAIKHLIFDPSRDVVSGNEQLFVLPKRTGTELEYHLVYLVNVIQEEPPANFMVFVDAHDGEIIWRHNRVRYADVNVHVDGEVQLVLPTGPFVAQPFANQDLTIGTTHLTTDSAGNAVTDISSSAALTTRLDGPFVNVNRDDGPDAQIDTTVNPGDSLYLIWDNSNAHPAERDAFYHVNLIHDFITTLDPALTNLDYSMPCVVNINNFCNAFWNGTGVNFFKAGGGCPNTGQMPSVVYHEYGHGINDKLYAQAGAFFGMINGATHEGMADVAAAVIEDTPEVGRGFFGVGSVLRNLDNTNRYPEDISGEVHHDGLIIGGAFWHLRELTSLQTAQELSHFPKWATPDDPNTGIAFSEWFVEVLVADDNDGNLNNGTPHFNEINQAFNQHGIGTGLFMLLSFAHTPLEDTQDTLNTYPVNFHLEGIGLAGSDPDSVFLHYTVDNYVTNYALEATQISAGEYQAEIPAQAAGSVVRYFMTAYDPLGNNTLQFPISGDYNFLVGFNSHLLDELEVESGWIAGAPDDDATTGMWERDAPQQTTINNSVVQPGSDHTPNGTDCFVTDATAGSGVGSFDVDDGKTTLFTPVYDLENLEKPVIRYYKWFTNDQGGQQVNDDPWIADISSDSGQTWVRVEKSENSTDGWEKFQFLISDFVMPTSTVMLRFIASDSAPGNLVEALIDDFEILAVNVVTSIQPQTVGNNLPQEFALSQNFPNPFNPVTTINYQLPEEGRVRLTIYNTLGQKIRTLTNGWQNAGYYTLEWNARNDQGNQVGSGVYIYKLQAGNTVISRKMLLMK